jgi:hypothetical protein
MRAGTQGMSLVAWVGCMLATAPRRTNRGMSARSTICACSTRSRGSARITADLAASSESSSRGSRVADRVGGDLPAAAHRREHQRVELACECCKLPRCRSIAVRGQQRGAAAAERAVDVQLDADQRVASVAVRPLRLAAEHQRSNQSSSA